MAVGSMISQIELVLNELPESEKKVAEYILSNAGEVMHMTIHELAKKAEASSAAVVRFCRSLGIDGFPALKIRLSAEVKSTPHVGYFDVESNETVHSIINKTLSNTVLTLQNTASQLDMQSIEQAVKMLHQAKVIYIYGIGASFIIAEDAAQKWIRLGKNVYAISDRHLLAAAMATQSQNAVFWGISYSGETREVIQLMKRAKEIGIKTISLSRPGNNKLSQLADVSLFTARAPEAKLRSAATSSRLAQLFVLDVVFSTYASAQYDFTVEQIEKTKQIIERLYD
ncbi:MurR/RpiR family transcriptional regulator [Brevibacillus daliensis]|uniref:MurR/RpiR family transcriptional regulator n=1 Tax=Brevibacillus daliensis TaxID=2892995 RepID=UPI001E53C619|nr:MurR/RpiR family transcriptional regulator [Brevibacillus daliensis]